MLLYLLTAFMAGFAVRSAFFNMEKTEKLIEATIPIATLVSDFEDFARHIEGGTLSIEGDAALKALKAHVEKKALIAPIRRERIKKKRSDTWDGSIRTDEWCDMRCFERELEKAIDDKERAAVIARYMDQYFFTTKWQSWCINLMKKPESREELREIFKAQ